MNSQLKTFEEYINSLTNLGVFPSLYRHSNGWSCVLRNASNQQIMPINEKEICWGETLMNSLTVAVEGLNRRFNDPKELHKYIDTGIDHRSIEPLQNAKFAYA